MHLHITVLGGRKQRPMGGCVSPRRQVDDLLVAQMPLDFTNVGALEFATFAIWVKVSDDPQPMRPQARDQERAREKEREREREVVPPGGANRRTLVFQLARRDLIGGYVEEADLKLRVW